MRPVTGLPDCADAERIRAEADATAVKMIADANRSSAQMRARGDEEAASIYTAAYQKDPEFYALFGSLQAYRDVFNSKSTIMVLKPDNQFFQYFNQAHSAQTNKNK